MFNLLNKSVKTINNGISTFISNITSESNYKTEIDFVKFGNLNLNLLKLSDLKELENNQSENDYYFKEFNVLYIVYSKCYLNIYYLNDDLEFLCFFNQKFNFTIEKVGSILTSMNIFCSDKVPLIGIITNKEPNSDFTHVSSNVNFRGNLKQGYKNEYNGTEYNKDYFHDSHNNIGEYCLKIYSLKTKNIVFNMRKKIKIDNFISNRKILGLSFVNGRIELFNTINFEKILKIKSFDFSITKEIISEKQNNKKENHLTSNYNYANNNNFYIQNNNTLKINYVKDKNQVKSKPSDNNAANSQNKPSGPLFDLTEDYIIFYNYKNKYSVYPSKKVCVNRRNRKSSDATRKSSSFEENQSKSSNRKNTKEKKTSSERRKKEFSKIKNLPSKKSNSLSKSQSFGNRNDSSSNNKSKINQMNSINKPEKATKLSKNGFHKNYLNINYVNNNINNDHFHQNSNPSEAENEYGSYNNNANPNAFDIISTDIYERMSELTNWSFSQINDFKNLHQASHISNNNHIKLFSNSSIVTMIFFNYEQIQESKETNSNNNNNANCTNNYINYANLNSPNNKNPFTPNPIQNLPNQNKNFNNINNDPNNLNATKKQENNNKNKDNSNNNNQLKGESEKERQQKQKIILTYFQSNIYIPFFNDGIGSLQFLKKGKLFIVGNKNSQMFYIYENFPASNLKHDMEQQAKRSIYRNKISYSVFRGITKGVINNIDLSACSKYLIISSNKGTFHLFGIPKKHQQINENANFFDYEFYNENNNRIVNAVNIEKIKYSGFIENCGNYVYKTASKLLSGCKIDLDEIDAEIKKHIVKTNLAKKINANLLLNFSEYDSSVNIHLIHNEKGDKLDDSGIYNFNFGGLNGYLNNGFPSGFGNSSVNCKSNLNGSNNNKAANKIGNNALTAASSFFANVSANNEEKKEKIFLIRKIDLSESLIKINSNYQIGSGNIYSEKVSEISTNFKNLSHKVKQNYYKPKNNLKQFIDWETTTRNFPTLQTHPLFSFNYYKKQRSSLNNVNSISIVNSNNNCNSNSNIIGIGNNNNNGSNYFEINLNNINSNNNTSSGAKLNSNKILGFNLNANNINNLIQNKNSRNNHNTHLLNNPNSNNSNNFQIIQNIGSNSNTNNNNNSNANQGLNSFVNISSSGNNKDDSNSENLEIIIDNDKKEFINIEKVRDNKAKEEINNYQTEHAINDCENKINNNNYFIKNENVKKINTNKPKNKSRNNNNNEKEKTKNINLKYKKQIVYDNSISINSSSYSLGSSMEKNKIKFLIEKNKSESLEIESGEANQSFNALKKEEKKPEAKENSNVLDLGGGARNQAASGNDNRNTKALLESEPFVNEKKNYNSAEEIKEYSKTPVQRNLDIKEDLKFLVKNQKGNTISNRNENENLSHNEKESNESELKNSNISILSANKNKIELVKSATIDSNMNRITFCSNNDSNRLLNHKKSFDSSINQNNNLIVYNSNNNTNYNNNLNNSAIDNLLAEKLICNDLEYFEINFNSNKQIQKSDFFLDNYIGPKLIINPFDVYNSNSNKNSRKSTRENTELRPDNASSSNKDNKTNVNSNPSIKENNEKASINVNLNNNLKTNSNNNDDDFYNNKEYILKTKIQEAMKSNIMDRIVSSSDSIVRFTGEFKIDEDYIKK